MKLVDGQTVGIDLGTTYSAIARLNENGEPASIPGTHGELTTPSVVILGNDGHISVGPSTEELVHQDPACVVEAIKREMGRKDWYKVYQNRRLTPEFISALILKKLKQEAETRIGPIGNAVITVPYYFNDLCRKATQDAGHIAGFNVLDILNEPTAATLAYAWIKGELGRTDLQVPERTIMVYDLGGGTFDVTAVKYTPTHFHVVATDGDVRLGGIDWSRRIVDHVAEQFTRKYGGDDPRQDPATLLAFTQEAEAVKRELSSRTSVPLTLTYDGKSITVAVTRDDFEKMSADLLQRTVDTTELVLEQAGIDPKQLDEILLVGGSTHMPAVEQALTRICGRAPSRSLNPDIAVAQGAAIHAAILEAREAGGGSRMAKAVIKRLKSVTTHDVNSHSLGVEISDPKDTRRKKNHSMIPRNTPIPHKVLQKFRTDTPNPTSIVVRLLEGEVSDVDACTLIGDCRILGLPEVLPVGSPVEVSYSYDSSGRIHVGAKEITSNTKATTAIHRDVGLNDDGLEAFRRLAADYQVE
jgi:molecular chaperone DnaK